jgi:hypothetical protein
MVNSTRNVVTYHVSLLAFANNDSRFYDTFIVYESSADTIGLGEFAKMEVATKFVNLIFDICIQTCRSQIAYEG